MASENKVQFHFPILGILGLIFITLKLTGHIGWSWWWVTAPFWGGFALGIGIVIVAMIVAVIAHLAERK